METTEFAKVDRLSDLVIKFTMPLPFIVSTNDMYFHRPKKSKSSGRITTYTVKTNELKEFQEYMSEELPYVLESFKDKISDMKRIVDSGYHGLIIVSEFYMPFDNYESSDTSNCIKAYEDCVSRLMDIDDKKNLVYHAEKRCSPSDKWYVNTIISVCKKDNEYIRRALTYCTSCLDFTHSVVTDNMICCELCNTKKLRIIDSVSTESADDRDQSRCNVCNSVLIGINSDKECSVCHQKYLIYRYKTIKSGIGGEDSEESI